MDNHVGIYGSKVAEGFSAFQRRSCINLESHMLKKNTDTGQYLGKCLAQRYHYMEYYTETLCRSSPFQRQTSICPFRKENLHFNMYHHSITLRGYITGKDMASAFYMDFQL